MEQFRQDDHLFLLLLLLSRKGLKLLKSRHKARSWPQQRPRRRVSVSPVLSPSPTPHLSWRASIRSCQKRGVPAWSREEGNREPCMAGRSRQSHNAPSPRNTHTHTPWQHWCLCKRQAGTWISIRRPICTDPHFTAGLWRVAGVDSGRRLSTQVLIALFGPVSFAL